MAAKQRTANERPAAGRGEAGVDRFHASWAPGTWDWSADDAPRTLYLRDMDDTENSDEEEDEAFEEDEEEDEEEDDQEDDQEHARPVSDILWTAEPNASRGHGKPSREEVEEELEEMEREDGDENSEALRQEPEQEPERGEGSRRVDRAIDSALRMRALVASEVALTAEARGSLQ